MIPSRHAHSPQTVRRSAKPLRLRLPRVLHAELSAPADEMGVSMNELVTYAVERIVREARAAYAALAQRVWAQKRERRRKGGDALLAARDP